MTEFTVNSVRQVKMTIRGEQRRECTNTAASRERGRFAIYSRTVVTSGESGERGKGALVGSSLVGTHRLLRLKRLSRNSRANKPHLSEDPKFSFTVKSCILLESFKKKRHRE